MSETKTERIVHGIMAEFTSVDSLLDACRRVRDAGYTKTDAYTPFPVHGIDRALGIKPTVLPWIALAGGLSGTLIALSMQIWMNGIDYKYIISGKPFISLPAFMPVAFELTILLASFGAFFGMWALNGLPKFSNPMFTDPRFDRATDDRFFLYIDAKDERYDADGVRNLLTETGSGYINEVVEDDSPKEVPKPVFLVWGLMVAFSIVPLLCILTMRVTNSSRPRFHVFFDMDFSPAKDAQQVTSLFYDNRAMRPDVPGTVARGQLSESLDMMTGINVEELAQQNAPRAERLVRAYLQGDEQAKAEEVAEVSEQDPPADEADADAAEEGSSDEQPAQQDSADDASAEDKPAEDKPAEEKPADDQPAAEKSAEDEPGKEEPAENPPAEEKPAEDKAAEEPTPSESSPQATGNASQPSVMETTPWLKQNPLTIDADLLAAGKKQFGIYCSVCHGMDGRGNGLVNRRAQAKGFDTWVPPASLHQETLYADQYPDGKLFSTISNGIRKMPGYASQIQLRDRWAIVSYVRALQMSQNASMEMVPESRREEIEREVTQVKAELERQAEEAAKAAAEREKKSS
ncbi:DUF3341 domain-containing protein [Roseiconus nitratireducens]|uniref:DUF3341 domain-containing protein n=2 Tax=Roseiconus nitratireducens TaxID=2605748 RepID=A0A5M6DIL6_9BACT|nr:DUF3341 domain-containing protein [Roseiconus nitratireducens]